MVDATAKWYRVTSSELLQQLASDGQQGLNHNEAAVRLARDGPNKLVETRDHNLLQMIANQFRDFMILVLLAAAVISGFAGDLKDAIVIMVIVLLNAMIGVVQEYRAERAISVLRQMATPSASVIRDGFAHMVPTSELVRGDLVMIEAGNVLPADLRLLEAVDLAIDESALTGESVVVEKQVEALDSENLVLGDQSNMGWKGTLVAHGRGKGIVVATAMQTQIGQIASLLHGEAATRTPLQERLSRFGRYLAMVVLAICAIVFFAGILQGQPLLLMFLTAISLAVAAIPEALPAIVTISLAMGARKMSRHNALIRRLPAVETLGSVTYICSDKTGTLTENRMHLEHLLLDGGLLDAMPGVEDDNQLVQRLGLALAVSNDVSGAGDTLLGDPTEIAFYSSAKSAGFHKLELEKRYPRFGEVQFSSERKCMSTLHHADGKVLLLAKGAPESMLPLCIRQMTRTGSIELDSKALHAKADMLAKKGYRVLAFACRELDGLPTGLAGEELERALERNMTFLGFVALIDPPREQAEQAVAECRSAGIHPVMITGDHPGTAMAIARRVGIADTESRLLTGNELAELSDAEFEIQVNDISVYARVSPEQKIRIVRALQEKGEYVAMTGDGVNDAPALKRAAIGIAMGRKGTDVAREAADMVLLDDNFATIVLAVREGRRIFDNIRKFIKYTMTSNSGEIWTLFLAPFLGLPIPLLPIHILWINLVTDGLPGLALASEAEEKNIMQRKPRPPQESIFAHGMWQHMLWVGLLIGGLSIVGQSWAIKADSDNWQTVVFTVLTLSQLFHALAVRSDSVSLFSLGFFTNRPLVWAIFLSIGFQLAVIYMPFFNGIFKTAPLTGMELLVCVLLSSVVLVATEIEKLLVRRGRLYG